MDDQKEMDDIQKKLNDYLSQSKKQIDEIKKLFDSVLSKSNEFESKFTTISEIIKKLETIELTSNSKYDQLNNFFNEFENGLPDKKSLKQGLLEIIDNSKKRYDEFEKLKIEINQYHNDLLLDQENKDCLKTQITNLISKYEKSHTEITTKYKEIVSYYNEMFTGTSDKPAIKSQITLFLTSQDKLLKENENKLSQLASFYEKVFSDSKTKDGKTLLSLKSTLDQFETRFLYLITESENKLQALTDSSLHNAFATRAAAYTEDFKKMEKYSIWCIAGIVIDIISFGIFQTFNIMVLKGSFNYNVLIYQFSISFALIYALWMYNRNQKIAKKLAEEYHHKASLAEAMTGYRKLYDLSHDDPEYMKLFDSIKDQLNINPSMKIDTFLNLKSPQEEITSTLTELTKIEKAIDALKNKS